jgi:hypothetical protein
VAGCVVLPDQVSLGVLVSMVSRDVIDAAVTACGVGDRRSGGKLPAHVTAYLTMGLCLFAEDDYEEVATKVTGSLDRWGCWDASWSVPTSSGITQARKRLGRNVFAEIFEGVAQPVGGMLTRGALLRRWRVLAIDGFDVDLPDTEANAAEFGYAGSGQSRSAYPQARVVALSECGTHAFLAAEVAPYAVGGKTLANACIRGCAQTSCSPRTVTSTSSRRGVTRLRPERRCCGGPPPSSSCRWSPSCPTARTPRCWSTRSCAVPAGTESSPRPAPMRTSTPTTGTWYGSSSTPCPTGKASTGELIAPPHRLWGGIPPASVCQRHD